MKRKKKVRKIMLSITREDYFFFLYLLLQEKFKQQLETISFVSKAVKIRVRKNFWRREQRKSANKPAVGKTQPPLRLKKSLRKRTVWKVTYGDFFYLRNLLKDFLNRKKNKLVKRIKPSVLLNRVTWMMRRKYKISKLIYKKITESKTRKYGPGYFQRTIINPFELITTPRQEKKRKVLILLGIYTCIEIIPITVAKNT